MQSDWKVKYFQTGDYSDHSDVCLCTYCGMKQQYPEIYQEAMDAKENRIFSE